MVFDRETDVLIVGYGGAGASAAIAAYDAGARVLVLEKSPRGGGNTRLGTLTFAYPEDTAGARQHIWALCAGTVDDETIDVFVSWASQNLEFIRSLGGEVAQYLPGPSFPNVVGADAMRRYYVRGHEAGGVAIQVWSG